MEIVQVCNDFFFTKLAIKPISRGQELTVDYLYDMDSAEQWYRDLYHKTRKRHTE